MRLLHFEDSPFDAELVAAQLMTEWPGCEVVCVSEAAGFEAQLRARSFDAILSDYSLPGFDGLRALALARERAPDTPFIFLSGTIGEERAIEALKRGAHDYVLKDRPARLVPALRAALSASDQARERRAFAARVQRQASLLDKAHDAIVVVDAEGCVTYWNAGAEHLYGWPAAEVIGRDRRELLFEADTARYAAALAAVRVSGQWRGELRPRVRDGRDVLVDGSWSLVNEDPEGSPSIFCIESDITERHQLEAQLRRAQRLESIGLLAGGIAHDLNNVLSPILLATDLLRTGPLRPGNAEMLDTIEASARHGSNLVRQVLAFARGAEGRKMELSLRHLVHEIVPFLRQTMPAVIRIEDAFDRELPPIEGDATQLTQVLMNLCINARDAMPEGGRLRLEGRRVEVTPEHARRADPEARPGPHVCLAVVDTGTGIPASVLSKIFDPFFTTKEAGKGTGLGLSIVRGIAKGHGGFLEVESEVGRGTAFRLYLPARATPAATPAAHSSPAPAGRGEGILVIEDDVAGRQLVATHLLLHGYRVWTAGDADTARSLLQNKARELALVLADVVIPGAAGAAFLGEIAGAKPGLPVLATSGMPESELHLPEGVGFLPKPLTAQKVLLAVREVLDAPR